MTTTAAKVDPVPVPDPAPAPREDLPRISIPLARFHPGDPQPRIELHAVQTGEEDKICQHRIMHDHPILQDPTALAEYLKLEKENARLMAQAQMRPVKIAIAPPVGARVFVPNDAPDHPVVYSEEIKPLIPPESVTHVSTDFDATGSLTHRFRIRTDQAYVAIPDMNQWAGPHPITITDITTSVTNINRMLATSTGITRGDILGTGSATTGYAEWIALTEGIWANTASPYALNQTIFTESKKSQARRLMRSNLLIRVAKDSARIPIQADTTPAEIKARETLRDMLTESDWRRYVTNGFVMVKAASGKWYQVFGRHSYDRIRVYKDGKQVESVCIHTDRECPPSDHVINCKVMIELDEEGFRASGNIAKLSLGDEPRVRINGNLTWGPQAGTILRDRDGRLVNEGPKRRPQSLLDIAGAFRKSA